MGKYKMKGENSMKNILMKGLKLFGALTVTAFAIGFAGGQTGVLDKVGTGVRVYAETNGNCGADNKDNVTYTLDDNGVLTLTGTGDMAEYGDGFAVPWGKDIPSWLSIKQVIINDGITSISPYAFYGCSNVSQIIIPPSVTKIGNNAFTNAGANTAVSKLTVVVPSGASLGETLFYNNNINKVNFITVHKASENAPKTAILYNNRLYDENTANDECYFVAYVSDSDVEGKSNLVISGEKINADSSEGLTTDTVYKNILVNDVVLSAKNIFGEDGYLYALKLDSVANTDSKTISALEKLTAELN
ncbi:MAG TPA: hypothetical protein DCG28_05365 [Lachnospiraceae bacterium]|nr:hypothetical protein [Lachnospiraceae bacterium]